MSEFKTKLKEIDELINEKTSDSDLKEVQRYFKKWSQTLFQRSNFSSFDVNCTCNCGEFTKSIKECSFCCSDQITINEIEFKK